MERELHEEIRLLAVEVFPDMPEHPFLLILNTHTSRNLRLITIKTDTGYITLFLKDFILPGNRPVRMAYDYISETLVADISENRNNN